MVENTAWEISCPRGAIVRRAVTRRVIKSARIIVGSLMSAISDMRGWTSSVRVHTESYIRHVILKRMR